ncbi:hypothetical protein [Haloferula sp. BvORR071]|uniref:hypothetical protein n=1 Tax=Haloferula sp. BvORR071 TaxID=1396141 RepID=UPI00055908F9|nr:hypothetical protein [Haloferula sp. BvORR071]
MALLLVLAWRLWPWFGAFTGMNVAGANSGIRPDAPSLPPAAAPVEIRSGLSRMEPNGLRLAFELLFVPHAVRHGNGFKRDDPALPPPIVEQLAAVLADPATYESWTGEKMCGGFHGDWYLRWGDGADRREVIVCMGCGEALIYRPESSLRCDLSKTAVVRIEAITATLKLP